MLRSNLSRKEVLNGQREVYRDGCAQGEYFDRGQQCRGENRDGACRRNESSTILQRVNGLRGDLRVAAVEFFLLGDYLILCFSVRRVLTYGD